ncbi:unnamed protein product [Dicrocoelium dendriticum]|nr:unnamed protein product [Dicrocoelium dendriticum]
MPVLQSKPARRKHCPPLDIAETNKGGGGWGRRRGGGWGGGGEGRGGERDRLPMVGSGFLWVVVMGEFWCSFLVRRVCPIIDQVSATPPAEGLDRVVGATAGTR